jgi:hypothetical protein
MTDNDEPLEPINLGPSDPWGAPAASAEPPPDPGSSRSSRAPRSAATVALVIIMIVAGVTAYFVTSAFRTGTSLDSASTSPRGPNSPNTTPADPKQSALSGIVVQQQDVTSDHQVGLLNNGDRLTESTLDLCNGTFASEKLRTARVQVAEVDTDDSPVLSTEAVLYKNDAATAQAFTELQQVARACPHRAVASPTGGDTLVTTFNAPPDKAWPKTPTVDRLAYDFNSTSTSGASGTPTHFVTAYLRRGRAFLGVYFAHPDGAQPAVRGQTTVPGIVALFEKRLAALPDSVVNG